MEIVFTAPKSVSTLWALAPDYYAHKIRGCTRSAAEAATFHVEKALNWDPHDGQDSSSTRKAAVFALIHEDASREDNPDLHTHVLACNFDGRIDQMNHHTMTRIQAHASFTYDRHLRSRLEHLLRYTMESEQGGFRIKGVPKHICDHFSKPGHALLLFPGDRHRFWKETASRAGWGERDAEALIETTAQQKRFTEQFDMRRTQERLAGVLQRRSAGQPKVTHSKEGTESNQRSSEQQHQGQSH